LLHDCAKGLDASSLIRLIREGGISLDNTELGMPSLLHAPAGAVLAKVQYGVNDPDVLSAIRWHTTGRRNMNLLDKIIYLADLTEPLRYEIPGLSAVRNAALNDINEAVRLAAQCTASNVLARGKRLHPRTNELSGAIK
jgi:predicted HD superfamily hydrolase involved in NAD metabolism